MEIKSSIVSIFSAYKVHPLSQASKPNPEKKENPNKYDPPRMIRVNLETSPDGTDLIKQGNLDLYA